MGDAQDAQDAPQPGKRGPKVPEPDMKTVKLSVTAPQPARKALRGARERSKVQQAFDALVTKAHAQWVKAGQPEKWEDRPLGAVNCMTGQELQVRRALTRAGAFTNLSIRFGEDAPVDGQEGVVSVVFSATDKKIKES